MGGICEPATGDENPRTAPTPRMKKLNPNRQDHQRRSEPREPSRSANQVESRLKGKKRPPSRDIKEKNGIRRRSKPGGSKPRESFSKRSDTAQTILPFERSVPLEEMFKKVKKLGRGSFGVVWRVKRNRDGKTYACKEISKEHCTERELDLIYLECEMMHLCRHKHICRLLEVFDGRDSVSMVMEEMKGGELFDRLVEVQEFTERDCAKQIRCIFQALAHMHSLGIVHRDLKPENLCYRDKDCTRLKVIDLGLSCYVDDCPPDACGTFEFLAPEQMLEKGYDERIDVFALGIITYVMMIGKSPFAVPKDELKAWDELHVWYRKMARTRITFGGNNTVSKAGQRFIKGCLAIDPEERLTAEQAANHEWFTVDDSEGPRSRRHTLDATQLKKYQIMNRLKRGIRTMICLKRMAKLLLEENERYQRSQNRGPSATRLSDNMPERFIRQDSWSVSIAHLPLSQRIQAVATRRESRRSNANVTKNEHFQNEFHYLGHNANKPTFKRPQPNRSDLDTNLSPTSSSSSESRSPEPRAEEVKRAFGRKSGREVQRKKRYPKVVKLFE